MFDAGNRFGSRLDAGKSVDEIYEALALEDMPESEALQMYARHKKLDLRSATVSVEHDKIHATDCMDCETSEGRIDEFRRSIRLDGDLNDDQRKRMLEIADRCPVHRTLHGEVKIRSTLA